MPARRMSGRSELPGPSPAPPAGSSPTPPSAPKGEPPARSSAPATPGSARPSSDVASRASSTGGAASGTVVGWTGGSGGRSLSLGGVRAGRRSGSLASPKGGGGRRVTNTALAPRFGSGRASTLQAPAKKTPPNRRPWASAASGRSWRWRGLPRCGCEATREVSNMGWPSWSLRPGRRADGSRCRPPAGRRGSRPAGSGGKADQDFAEQPIGAQLPLLGGELAGRRRHFHQPLAAGARRELDAELAPDERPVRRDLDPGIEGLPERLQGGDHRVEELAGAVVGQRVELRGAQGPRRRLVGIAQQQILERPRSLELGEVGIGAGPQPRALVELDRPPQMLDGERVVAGQAVVGGHQVVGLGGSGRALEVTREVLGRRLELALEQQHRAHVQLVVGGGRLELARLFERGEGGVVALVDDLQPGQREPPGALGRIELERALEVAPAGLGLAHQEPRRGAQEERRGVGLGPVGQGLEHGHRVLGTTGIDQDAGLGTRIGLLRGERRRQRGGKSENRTEQRDGATHRLDSSSRAGAGARGGELECRVMPETAPSPVEIAAALERRVIGQREAVREMATALSKKLAGLRVGNILLVGASGTGKTTLMRAVETYLAADPQL